jgi:hypothetical protein
MIGALMKAVWTQDIFDNLRRMFEDLNSATEFNRPRPVIDRTFALKEAAECAEIYGRTRYFHLAIQNLWEVV